MIVLVIQILALIFEYRIRIQNPLLECGFRTRIQETKIMWIQCGCGCGSATLVSIEVNIGTYVQSWNVSTQATIVLYHKRKCLDYKAQHLKKTKTKNTAGLRNGFIPYKDDFSNFCCLTKLQRFFYLKVNRKGEMLYLYLYVYRRPAYNMGKKHTFKNRLSVVWNNPEVEFTNFLGSRVYLGFLKSRLKSRFQEVVIHQFRAKNATWVVILAWVTLFNNTD
jgi:hypothetical protein